MRARRFCALAPSTSERQLPIDSGDGSPEAVQRSHCRVVLYAAICKPIDVPRWRARTSIRSAAVGSGQLGETSRHDGSTQPGTAHPGRFAPVDERQLVLSRPAVLEVLPAQPEVEALGPGVLAAQAPERAVAGEEAPG